MSGEHYCIQHGAITQWVLKCEPCLDRLKEERNRLERLNLAYLSELKDYGETVARLRRELETEKARAKLKN